MFVERLLTIDKYQAKENLSKTVDIKTADSREDYPPIQKVIRSCEYSV